MRKYDDAIRAVSRHTLAYILCAISELFRHYDDFDPLDLLVVHAVLNANVINIINDQSLDDRFASIYEVEPDDMKQGKLRMNVPPPGAYPSATLSRDQWGGRAVQARFSSGSGATLRSLCHALKGQPVIT